MVIQPGETNCLRYRRIEREKEKERATRGNFETRRNRSVLPGQWQLLSPLSLPVKLDRKPTRNLQPLRWRGLATTARRHRRGGSPRDREPPLNPAKEKRRERCLFRKLGSSVLSLFLSLSLSSPEKGIEGKFFLLSSEGKERNLLVERTRLL